MKCPVCNLGTMSKKTITKEFTYKQREILVEEYKALVCDHCEEEIVPISTIDAIEPQIKGLQQKGGVKNGNV